MSIRISSKTSEEPAGNSLASISSKPSLSEKIIKQNSINDGTTNYWLTEGNVKRLEWAVGSTTAATSAVFTAIFGAPVIGAAASVIIPLALAGGSLVCAYNAYYTPDYDNTKEVAGYREKAKSSSLEETFNAHGPWVNKRKILTQEQLEEKYLDETKDLATVPKLLEYHKKIEQFLKDTDFILASPEEYHRKRLQNDCLPLSLTEIIKHQTLDHIFAWKLLTPKSFEEKYLQTIHSLKGIPSIIAFYEDVKKSLQKSGASDYTLPNPTTLKGKFRKDCESMSFKDIADLHSLQYIFSWELLTSRQFSQKYQQYADNLFAQKGITAVISSYKKTLKARNSFSEGSYEVPHPKILKNLWSTKKYSLEEILAQNIDELNEYEIISSDFRSFLQSFHTKSQNIYTNYQTDKAKIEAACSKERKQALDQLNMVKKPTDIAKQALEEKQREQNRRILDVSHELQIARNRGNYSNIERLEEDLRWLKSDRFFDDFFRTYPNWNELDRNLSKAKEAYNQTIVQINKREEDHIASLNQRYSLEKAALETEFQKMKRH